VKSVFVEQIRERDRVESQFLVRDKITAMAKNGKPYLTLKLMDRTGEIEGRIWDRVDDLAARFEKDDFVRVQGKASVYLGKMQLVVQQLEKVAENNVDLADYLPVCPRPVEEMIAELRGVADSLESPHFQALMAEFLDDEEFLRLYAKAPAAKAIHHVYLGGLLEHSLAVARLAEDVCRHYPGVQRDLLITAALLHDIGKVSELCYERSFAYTDTGKLLGHIVIGVEMVEERLRRLPEFPPAAGILLKHLLLSHHGQYEFGSPKRPKTLEAVILNYLDDLDSKINGIRTHFEKEPDSVDGWTGYHRIYDRYFFRDSLRGEDLEEPSAPQPAVSPAPAVPSPPPAPRRERSGSRELRFSLGDQLQGKNLDLFSQGGKGGE
jgi:3'-5' exoribonuclease